MTLSGLETEKDFFTQKYDQIDGNCQISTLLLSKISKITKITFKKMPKNIIEKISEVTFSLKARSVQTHVVLASELASILL